MRFDPLGLFRSWPVRGRVPVFLVVVGMVMGGCTVTSFLGSQYTNFTAYYNKFHNAEKAFEKGVEQMSSDDRSVDRTRYLSLFPESKSNANTSSFDKAIRKSADVLREHPDSKWVDDALLLIGKSYFYQQNYVGATQKFREVLSLDAERAGEARFWLARTLLEVERYEELTAVIQAGVQEGEASAWTARLALVRGVLHTRQQQWEEAAQALNRGLQGDLPERLAARASFLLGQTLETMERPSSARAAYRQVQDHDPSYELGLAARLSDIELQGQHGDVSRALDRLEDLEDDEKNYEKRGEMAAIRARIYRAQGQRDRARRTLTNMMYREDAPSGTAMGRLHYDLARLYRDDYKDFSQAAAHFDTARTSLAQGRSRGTVDARRLPGAPQNVDAEADRYRNLARRTRDVARMDSLLRVGRMSDPEFQRFVDDLRRQRRAEQQAEADEPNGQPSRRLRGGQRGLVEQRRGAAPAANTRQSDAGFLFHKDPARVQQGKRQFEQTWGDRPLVDNWRRRSAILSASTASSGGEEEETGTPEQPRSPGEEDGRAREERDEASTLDLSAIPRDSASQAKMEAERAVSRYELANSLFLAAGRPDSAATWYRRILQENGDHPVARRALYALAEAYRAQGDTTAAQQAYRRLVERHPDTDLAARARERLGRRQQASTTNRAALADSAYTEAYARWQEGKGRAALPALLDVADQYPDTEAAPRALLAAGLVYWKAVQRDSTTDARQVLERHLQMLRPSDSTDSASSPPDSTEAPSGEGVPDSVVTADRQERTPAPEAVPDSSRENEPATRDTVRTAPPDRPEGPERPVPPDGAAATDTARRASSDRTEANTHAPLDSLLRYLTDRYPDAPQVKRARTILDVIEERRSDPEASPADTTTQEPSAPDTTEEDPETIAQRRAQEQQDRPAQPSDRSSPDSSRTGPSGEADDDTEGDRDPLPAPPGVSNQGGENEGGQKQIDRSQGGWTLVVNTFPTPDEASRYVKAVGKRIEQWPVDLLEETQDDTTQHHLVVGQFTSKEAAEEAQQVVTKQLSSEPTIRKIP